MRCEEAVFTKPALRRDPKRRFAYRGWWRNVPFGCIDQFTRACMNWSIMSCQRYNEIYWSEGMVFSRSADSDRRILKNAGKLNLNKLSILPHEITDIYGVVCAGAYGDPNAWANFVYGKRPDGKTVRCKATFFNKDASEGFEFSCVYVWSSCNTNNTMEDSMIWISVFHINDWHKAGSMNKENQKKLLNEILRERRILAYQSGTK